MDQNRLARLAQAVQPLGGAGGRHGVVGGEGPAAAGPGRSRAAAAGPGSPGAVFHGQRRPKPQLAHGIVGRLIVAAAGGVPADQRPAAVDPLQQRGVELLLGDGAVDNLTRGGVLDLGQGLLQGLLERPGGQSLHRYRQIGRGGGVIEGGDQAVEGVADLVVEVLEIRPDLGLVRLIGGKILGIFPGFRKSERRKRHFAFLLNLLPRRPGGRCSP